MSPINFYAPLINIAYIPVPLYPPTENFTSQASTMQFTEQEIKATLRYQALENGTPIEPNHLHPVNTQLAVIEESITDESVDRFSLLPDELVESIFRSFDKKSLCACRILCGRFKVIANPLLLAPLLPFPMMRYDELCGDINHFFTPLSITFKKLSILHEKNDAKIVINANINFLTTIIQKIRSLKFFCAFLNNNLDRSVINEAEKLRCKQNGFFLAFKVIPETETRRAHHFIIECIKLEKLCQQFIEKIKPYLPADNNITK
jgi:hypothetical protein